MRRLLVLSSTFPRWDGDAEPGFVFDLCRALTERYSVAVVTPHAMGARKREVLSGIQVERFRYGPNRWQRLAYNGGMMANLDRNALLYLLLPLFFVAQFWAVVRMLWRFRPHSIHAHWMVPQGLTMVLSLAWGPGRPWVVCTAHGSDISALRGRAWTWLRRWVVSRCDVVTTVSDALRQRLVAEGCAPATISVIPMGADLREMFSPGSLERSVDELLFVGRLVRGKGLDILLHALPDIVIQHPGVRLTVVGGGPERQDLARLSDSLHVAQRVEFVGTLEHRQLANIYRRAALLVLPSREEGFGLVLVEAMGCGCPVVASDLPAVRSIVCDGDTGRLFRVADVEALARVICQLLSDGTARQLLSRTACTFVRERFDWHSIGEQYAALVEPRDNER